MKRIIGLVLMTMVAMFVLVGCGGGGGGGDGGGGDVNTGVPPAVVTLAATSIGATTATLDSKVTGNGLATDAWFEWGTNPSLSSFTSTSSQSVGSTNTIKAVNAVLTGLTTGTTYYYRVAASNSGGTTKGSILSCIPSVITPPNVSLDGSYVLHGFIIERDNVQSSDSDYPYWSGSLNINGSTWTRYRSVNNNWEFTDTYLVNLIVWDNSFIPTGTVYGTDQPSGILYRWDITFGSPNFLVWDMGVGIDSTGKSVQEWDFFQKTSDIP